jgi:hypothetical protein
VPGRACGTCTACCVDLPIETGQLRKAPGVACAHCTGAGCAIYEARFPICRTYHCGWWYFGELGEDWRPDRSGVLISSVAPDGVEFLVLGGESAIRRPGFAQFVAHCIAIGTPSFMAVPGPVGYYSARVFLNDRLKGRDPAGVRDALLGALAAAAKHEFRRMEGE